jgi:hypothetical protein
MSGVDNKWKKEDFAKGGATDFVNSGAGMFAKGGKMDISKLDELVGDKWINHSTGFSNSKKINMVLKNIINMWSDIYSFASGGGNYHISILLNSGYVLVFHNSDDITISKRKYKTLKGYYNSGNWGDESYVLDVDMKNDTAKKISDAIKNKKYEKIYSKYASGGATEFVNEGAGMFAKGGGTPHFTDFYLVVNLDERGLYSADVRNPYDEIVYSIKSTEQMNQLIEDGFLKYKADQDLNRLTKYLMKLDIIPNGSQIYSQEEFENSMEKGFGDYYAKGGNIRAVRNEDADYYVNEDYEIDDNGKIKRYAVEIQNDAGDVIDYSSAESEEDAQEMIRRINLTQKYAKGGATGRWNSGRSWHQDRARHNKSEKWEKPLANRKRYDEGGEMDEMKPKLSDDILMLLSQVKQIKHHADEILQMIDSDGHIDSWVIAKAERSATDISDIYHYLDGRRDIFCCGGTLEYGGAIVDYSYGLLADPRFDVQSPVFEDGGNILTEDTVARVDDPAFADVGQYAKGGEIDKEIIDASAKNIYEKQGMMGLRNIFLQTAQADENSGNKELADYRRMVVSEYQSKQPRYMAKGGKTGSNILKTYKRNEDRNLHSENVVLLAKNFGTKEDLAKAKEILKKHDDLGYLSSELDEERSALHKKLYPKLVEMNFDILNFED